MEHINLYSFYKRNRKWLGVLDFDFSKYPTVVLRDMLRDTQKEMRMAQMWVDYDERNNEDGSEYKKELVELTSVEAHLKSLLSTREHVPNAKERKAARIEKAKAQRNR